MIENIYSTVADPGAWPAVLRELIACSNSRSARLLVMNAEATRVVSSLKENLDDSYHRQYTEYYVNACPWRPELQQKPPGRLYSTYLHFSCRQSDFLRSEFYNDWAGPQDIHHGALWHHLSGFRPDNTVAGAAHRGAGALHRAGHGLYQSFCAPPADIAFQLSGQVADRCARAEAVAIAAEGKILPYLSACIIRCASSSAIPERQALLGAENRPLTFCNGHVEVADEACNQRLQRLMRDCLSSADSRSFHSSGGSLEVPPPNGARSAPPGEADPSGYTGR